MARLSRKLVFQISFPLLDPCDEVKTRPIDFDRPIEFAFAINEVRVRRRARGSSPCASMNAPLDFSKTRGAARGVRVACARSPRAEGHAESVRNLRRLSSAGRHTPHNLLHL